MRNCSLEGKVRGFVLHNECLMLSRFEEVVKQSSGMEKEFGSVLLNHEKEVSEFKKQQCLFSFSENHL